MRVSRDATPAFQPITITLDSPEEAQALKLLCTTTAYTAVLNKARRKPLAVDRDDVRDTADNVYHALKDVGVSYLNSSAA